MQPIQTKFIKYDPPVTPGDGNDRYAITAQKDGQTKYGRTKILTLKGKGEKRSLFVNYPEEASDQSTLAKLVHAFGTDPEQWIGRKIDISFDQNGRRRIEPVVK